MRSDHDAANRYMAAYRELVGAIVAKHGELRAREKAVAEGKGEAAVEEEVEVDKVSGACGVCTFYKIRTTSPRRRDVIDGGSKQSQDLETKTDQRGGTVRIQDALHWLDCSVPLFWKYVTSMD